MFSSTVMFLAFTLLFQSPTRSGRATTSSADPPQARAPKLKQGDLVRVTRLDPTGQPATQIVFATADVAKRFIRRMDEQNNAGRIVSLEGQIFIGHDTPGTFEQTDSVLLNGEEISLARVTISGGLLKGQQFWISARRLRNAREPDPARRILREGEGTSGPLLPIDPEYDAAIEDKVVLASRESPPYMADGNPKRDESKEKPLILALVLLQPRLPSLEKATNAQDQASKPAGFAAVDSGTAAIVKEFKGFYVKVRITSGPFEGQDWFVLRPFISRPEVFARTKAMALVPATRTKPAARTKTSRKSAQPVIEPTGDLVLTDLAVNTSRSGNLVTVSARFKNASAEPFKAIYATLSFEDRSGKLVRSHTAICEPNTIEPGEMGSFETVVDSDDRAAGIKLDFKSFEKSIRWTDRSGKNAHP